LTHPAARSHYQTVADCYGILGQKEGLFPSIMMPNVSISYHHTFDASEDLDPPMTEEKYRRESTTKNADSSLRTIFNAEWTRI